MKTAIALLLAAATLATSQSCYSMDGQKLDSRYQPCYPQASSSACCMLNGTQGENQANDLCLDSGLCQSTSGWYAGFLYINGCTDPSGKADGCARMCNFLGTQYSWSVLQCEPGKFCCRAASDTENCCGSNKTMIETSHIGSLLLPGSTGTINTAFNFTTEAPATTNASTGSNTTCLTPNTSFDDSTCPADRSAVVGGAVGGVLGAALIGALVALMFAMRSREQHKSNFSATSAVLATTESNAAEEKAILQRQLAEQQYAQTTSPQSSTYGHPHGKTPIYNVVEMPGTAYGVSELEERDNSRSELTAEQGLSRNFDAGKTAGVTEKDFGR